MPPIKEQVRNPEQKLTNQQLFASIEKNAKEADKSILKKIDLETSIDELYSRVLRNPNLTKSIPENVKSIIEKQTEDLKASVAKSNTHRKDSNIIGVIAAVCKWDCEKIEKNCKILGKTLPSEPFVMTAKIYLDAAKKMLDDARVNTSSYMSSNNADLCKIEAENAQKMIAKIGIKLRPFGEKVLQEWCDEANKIIRTNRANYSGGGNTF